MFRWDKAGTFLAFLTGGMKKILVIEDDDQVRDSVSLSLESAGYLVMGAATCQEGLQNHKQFCPSVIISDVVSLEHEGGDLIRRMCQQSAHLPLITLMGTLSDSDTASLRPQPIMPMSSHTLQKPFTLDELLATVQSALTR
ncbi:MAG: response regulator [Nitrospirales bacterium]|nr:MAG: response regulator [Nitrospirales bacterium]